ncbi:MAG: DUF3568 domain-containing protein [Deltaproteobacteria bacterium]|nr:DUF3568 domain-containing protein [Deltaproteobacteria bacterium]
METNKNKLTGPIVMGLFLLLTLSGCAAALGALSTLGSGVVSGADYLASEPVSKSVCYNYDRVKKALLVTLCKMVIDVEKVKEVKDGEKIYAKAEDLEIVIELKRVTPIVTRIKIKAGEGIVKRDKATATEIVRRTAEAAETLMT